MAPRPFLLLPQELRDAIYQLALIDSPFCNINEDPDHIVRRPKRITRPSDRWKWQLQPAATPPTATYYNLLRVNPPTLLRNPGFPLP